MSTQVEPKYAWPTWWGSVAKSDQPPAIIELQRKVRDEIGGLKASKKDGVAFPVRSAKDLMGKLRTALDKLGGACWVVGQDVKNIELERGTACMVQSKVRLGAEDGSFVDFVGVGHGADTQDKAAGKASTYAWKDALTKGLALPDADMVDTDDSGEPVPGGPSKAKGKSVIDEPFNPKTYVDVLKKARSEEGVRALIEEWRKVLPPDVALKVGPLAKARLDELKK